ncbi:hypothetical protein [Mesorhizobium sp. 10J20-29]
MMEVHSRPDQLYSMPQRPAKALLIDLLSDVLEMVAYGEDAKSEICCAGARKPSLRKSFAQSFMSMTNEN